MTVACVPERSARAMSLLPAPVLWRSTPDTLAAAGAVTAGSRLNGNQRTDIRRPGRRMVGNIR
jgi:hypothetical protein